MQSTTNKTPTGVTEFERAQLRFFLNREDIATVLTELIPSLAWLPMLAGMKLIKHDRELVPWVEKNFAEANAVREVAANLHFFSEEGAILTPLFVI